MKPFGRDLSRVRAKEGLPCTGRARRSSPRSLRSSPAARRGSRPPVGRAGRASCRRGRGRGPSPPAPRGARLSNSRRSRSCRFGKVTFRVTNKGDISRTTSRSARSTVKTPRRTPAPAPARRGSRRDRRASMSVTFKVKGKYGFLCTVAWSRLGWDEGPPRRRREGRGRDGLHKRRRVGGGGSTGGTTTTPGSSGPAAETLVGDPTAGASVLAQAGCASCHTLRAAGATGTVGPNLDNSKPGQQVVIQFVTNGTGVMPSFQRRSSRRRRSRTSPRTSTARPTRIGSTGRASP